MGFTDLLKNKIFIGFLICLLLFMVGIEYNQYRAKEKVDAEISSLESEAANTQQKNQDLQNFIGYLKTDDYAQKAAREQLNLKKDGESVYAFSNPTTDTPATAQAIATPQGSTVSISDNLKKWWTYFFNPSA